jgi:ABC-2 type transport system ATP-binding protein
MGLLEPSQGCVELDCRNILADLRSYKALLGYVPEEPHLYTYLTGPEYLQLIGRLREIPDGVLNQKIQRFLELFGIYDDRYQTLSSYSKGMRQKILIAAALLHSPELLLLDEPLSGLDVNASILIKDLLAALASDGKTILYSSHVLDVVEKICDRVLIIDEGNLIADGRPEDLKSSTQQSTLEDVFRKLTESESVDPGVSRIVEALRS